MKVGLDLLGRLDDLDTAVRRIVHGDQNGKATRGQTGDVTMDGTMTM